MQNSWLWCLSCSLCKQKIPDYEHFCKKFYRKSPDQRCPDCGCTKTCNLWTMEDIMKNIEKGWLMQAGRLALEEQVAFFGSISTRSKKLSLLFQYVSFSQPLLFRQVTFLVDTDPFCGVIVKASFIHMGPI